MAERRTLFVKISIEDLEKAKADLRSLGTEGEKSFKTLEKAGAEAGKRLADTTANANRSVGNLAQGLGGLAKQAVTGEVSLDGLKSSVLGFAGALGGPVGSIALVAALTAVIQGVTLAYEKWGKETDRLATAHDNVEKALKSAKLTGKEIEQSAYERAKAYKAETAAIVEKIAAQSLALEADKQSILAFPAPFRGAAALLKGFGGDPKTDPTGVGVLASIREAQDRIAEAMAIFRAQRGEFEDIFNRGGVFRTPMGPGGPGLTKPTGAPGARADEFRIELSEHARQLRLFREADQKSMEELDKWRGEQNRKRVEEELKAQEKAAQDARRPWEEFGSDLGRLMKGVFQDIADDGKLEFEKLGKAALASFANFGFKLAEAHIFEPLFDQLGKLLGSGGAGALKTGIGGAAIGFGTGSILSALGLGNTLGSQIGGGLGGALGGLALGAPGIASTLGLTGVATFLGTAAGPVGSIFGGLLGAIFGGLFGNKKPSVGPNAAAVFGQTAEGRPQILRVGGDNLAGSEAIAGAQQFAEAFATAINRTIDALGIKGLAFGGVTAGVNRSGFGIGIGSGFNLASGANAEQVIADALFRMLKDDRFFTGFSEEMGAALRGSTATNLEGLLADLERPALKRAFDETIELAILAFTNPTEAALREFDKAAEARLEEARKLGADLVEVEKLTALERQRITEQAGQSSLARFRDELTFGAISGASPMASLEGTRASFLAAAAQGDTGRIEELGRSLLTSSRSAFASGGGFQSDLELVRDVVGNLASPQSAVVAAINASAGEQIRLQAQMVTRLGQIANENAEMKEEIARLSAALQRLLAA